MVFRIEFEIRPCLGILAWNIKKGDIFYLFSDGFPDQFGATDGSKFLNSNFKQLLLSINDTPIEEQSSLLEKILHEWMAFNDQDGIPYKQVDDILVVGVKI
jgi:serine phosphatase RsbU (regulator of sigma subunit)